MAREESGDTDYGAWGGGGGGGVPGGWGGNADINSWDMSQSQLGNQRSQSRSPAANPPNNATYGNTAPSRLSPSIAGDTYAEARDSFGYESEGHHDHDQGHGHSWDPPAPTQHLSANNHNPAPSALASPAIRRISMQAPTGGVSSIAAAEAAQAELKSKPIKYTSASAAAKKVEAGNPNAAGNRDSLWSKTHELANNRLPPHATFAPKLRPQPVVLAPGKARRLADPACMDELGRRRACTATAKSGSDGSSGPTTPEAQEGCELAELGEDGPCAPCAPAESDKARPTK
ncbi:hypothetical protein DFP72DRAFT_560801 [Ephemerocybe angulata]|uniref:Uncharacterized protein n=1 Tax=Ephemerocybe angulata TaxID=980116 RepID=A0A8H6IDX6_9AGAR|nr:hypothetical protein DFP72DRAFT_560801 [Tulosesus angulatus]